MPTNLHIFARCTV